MPLHVGLLSGLACFWGAGLGFPLDLWLSKGELRICRICFCAVGDIHCGQGEEFQLGMPLLILNLSFSYFLLMILLSKIRRLHQTEIRFHTVYVILSITEQRMKLPTNRT
jgi:hypothetical protein